jgi:hypothetical protein
MSGRFSPIAFMVGFCCTYAFVFWRNWPMFLYYPEPGLWFLGPTPHPNVAGPSMAWYGLMADAAAVAGVLSLLVPNRWVDVPLRKWLWVFPISTMLVCLYLLRVFFA